MPLSIPAHVTARADGDVLLVRNDGADEQELAGAARAVFELVGRGSPREEIVGTLARDPFVGPLRASDLYDTTIADLMSRHLVVPAPRAEAALRSLALRCTPRQYPWYDSLWLGRWMGARDTVAREQPERVDELLALAEPLRTDPAFETKVLGRVADEALLTRIREVITTLDPRLIEMHEGDAFGRTLGHNHSVFNEIQQSLVGLASEAAGEELEPSYNFLSLYTNLGVCEPHMDAPSAKYTLDLYIDQSDPWPIHISQVVAWPEDWSDPPDDWADRIRSSPDLRFASYVLEPGEAVFFSGSSQWHYRDRHPSNPDGYCNLIFFHFIPQGTREMVHVFDP